MSFNKNNQQESNYWLNDTYGSKRGAVKTYWHCALNAFGTYRTYSQIHWVTVKRLVFVCKGNICRSAYSEAFAKSLGIDAVSCGLKTGPGNPANEVAIEVGLSRGFDLSGHKTTPVQKMKFRETDLILAMEPWQAEYFVENYSESSCTLLGLWGKPVKPYIHDPYGDSSAYFNHCFNFLEDSIHEVASKIKKN